MRITMVKKLLADGAPCEKCAQTEEMLRRRELWDRIDEVVWAVEGDSDSPGAKLGRQHGVDVAPFFIVEDASGEIVFESGLKLVREILSGEPRPAAAPAVPLDLAALARRLSNAEPQEIVRFALERWGERCAIAFSGAEDVVLIEMATRTGLPFSVFTLDTGRLHQETYAFLDEVRRRYGVAMHFYLPDADAVADLVARKGPNSFYRDGHRECCGIRKVEPMRRALRGHEAWISGQRRDQSPATRSKLEVVLEDRSFEAASGRLVKLNPLAGWTRSQIWEYIRAHDVPYNALHDRGLASIGCEPCTRAVEPGQHEREGRWWWEREEEKECGLHVAGDGI